MKIDDSESLKKWLVQVLTPIFDGDPEKLALYIVALAKKVEDDLSSRQRCIEDLEVFLEAQTNGFVDQLFDALVNKTYMGGATASSTHQTENPNPRTSSVPKEGANTSRGYQRTSRDHYDTGGGGGGGGSSYYHRRSTETGSSSRARSRSRSGGRRRSGRGTRGRRSRSRGNRDSSSSSSSSGLSPVKRRSRSRSLNSRSRSRSRSPAYRSSYRNEPHTRSVIRNPPKKQRCRDFDEKGFCAAGELCPYEHNNAVIAPHPSSLGGGTTSSNNPMHHHHPGPSNQAGMSSSFNQPPQQIYTNKRPKSHGDYQNKYNNNNGFNTNNNNGFNTNNNMFNIPHMSSLMAPPPNGAPLNTMIPPPQQQPIPNVGLQNPQLVQIPNRARNLVNVMVPPNQMTTDDGRNCPVKRSFTNDYNESPTSEVGGATAALLPTPQQAPIIPAPIMSTNNQPYMQQPQQNKQFNNQGHFTNQNNPNNFPGGMINQPKRPMMTANTANMDVNFSLVVRKIPVEMNRVDTLSQHFGKFGPIVDIQCGFEQNQDSALVVFANHQAAQAAYKCPQPVFNNRFIRLFWLAHHLKVRQQKQQPTGQQQQQSQSQPVSNSGISQFDQVHPEDTTNGSNNNNNNPEQTTNKRPVKERLSMGAESMTTMFPNKENQTGNNDNKFSLPPDERLTKTILNHPGGGVESTAESSSSATMDSQSSQQLNMAQLSLKSNEPFKKPAATTGQDPNLMMARKIQDENKRKAMLLKLEVQKKARELIEKQIKDQKILMEKFEKAKTAEEKSEILTLIKKISEAIEKEKEILNSDSSSQPKPKPEAHVRVTPAPHYLLKLNNKRLNTTSFLKTGASAGSSSFLSSPTPTSSATSPKIVQPPPASPSSFFNFTSHVSVDNRPRKLILTGIKTPNEKTNILNFIGALGVKIETVVDQNEPETDQPGESSVIINFATRKDAEFALLKCSASFTSKKIKIDWFKPPEQEKPQQQLKQEPQTQPQIQSVENSESFVKTEEAENPTTLDNNVTNDEETNREIKEESVDDVLGEEEQEPAANRDDDQQTDVFQDLFAN